MNDLISSKTDLDNAQAILSECLPWSPNDFIRELSLAGDRAMYAAHLTRDISERDDLRFLHELPGGEQIAVFAERLPWDSKFFGYDVARLNGLFFLNPPFDRPGTDSTSAIRQLLAEAKKRNIKYLFTTIDARDTGTMRALCQSGFILIETRCFYHRSLKNYSYQRRFPCRRATAQDIESLSSVAQTMVNPYDRFHSDPWIDPQDTLRMMRKWVEASIMDSFADITIVPDMPDPSAFCTVKYHKDKWDGWELKLSQPVFSAVSSDMRGWYMKIISEVNYHLMEMGAEYSFLSTQITNRSVIRVWEKLGYSFGKGEHVFRVVL